MVAGLSLELGITIRDFFFFFNRFRISQSMYTMITIVGRIRICNSFFFFFFLFFHHSRVSFSGFGLYFNNGLCSFI